MLLYFNGFCGELLMMVVVVVVGVVVLFWVFVLRGVVAATMVMVVGCCEFLWGKFYFILVSCLYYFDEMNVKIESLMFGVSC